MPRFNIDIHPDNFLPCYQHTLDDERDIEFFYGSRDSGKSRHIAQKKLVKAMRMPKFKCILIRKVFNTIKDSQWAMLKEIAEEWGVDKFFKFNTSPLGITCMNGAQFLCRGLDDPKKLKSVTNPTDAWVEEGDGIEENDWTLITTSLRSNDFDTQIDYSFNPDVPGDFQDFWLYKKYFQPAEPLLSFSAESIETIYLPNGDQEEVKLRYRATHTTWMQNPYCKPVRKAFYLGLARTSEYDHRVYCLGLWGTRKVGDEFFKRFQSNLHVKPCPFNPKVPIYCSVDNNVLPYCALTFWQLTREGDIYYARQIAEAPGRPPDNGPHGLAKLILRKLHALEYKRTGQFVGICGDRSTKNQSTIDERKRSFFQIVNEQVSRGGYRTEDKFLTYAPPPSSIADFCNAIFNGEIPELRIEIDPSCTESIKDYSITKTDKDGNILKKRTADYQGGPEYEHCGHLTDTAKDFVVQAFFPEFEKFCNDSHGTLEPGGLSIVNRVTNITP